MNEDKDCIFCKIVKGELPCYKIYEDDKVLAFLSLGPNTHGHTLLIPKEHFKDFTEIDTNLGNNMFEVMQKIGIAQLKGLKAEGFNIGLNNGPVAGQSIFHVHFHIIPRYSDDGLKHWKEHVIEQDDLVLNCEKIVKFL